MLTAKLKPSCHPYHRTIPRVHQKTHPCGRESIIVSVGKVKQRSRNFLAARTRELRRKWWTWQDSNLHLRASIEIDAAVFLTPQALVRRLGAKARECWRFDAALKRRSSTRR
jgi:hypothetical protein